MALRAGYKLTEVGILPEDWSDVPCEDVVSIVDGDRGFNYPSKSELKPDGFCLFLNTGNVTKNGFKFKDCEFISKSKDENLRKGRLKRLDVVLTTRGTVGNFAHFDDSVEFDNIRINSGMVILRQNNEGVSNSYLYAVLKSHILEAQIERLSFGSAQPQLTVKGISNFRIPIPPVKDEQRAIATALSDMDALLEGLDRLIAKKRDLKQATMQQLLTGKTRLPGFCAGTHLSSDAMDGKEPIEEEWVVKQLGDVIEKLVGGGTPSRANLAFWGGDILWVTVKDFTTFHPCHAQESITRLGLNNSASHLIPAGTLITSTRMALGKAVIYDVDVAINQDLKAIFLKLGNSVRFLYYWFEKNAQSIDELGSGSTVKGISIAELRRLPFPSISEDEQTAIATILSDMDAEIEALQQRRAKTRDLKQAMMQELLTGKTRLV